MNTQINWRFDTAEYAREGVMKTITATFRDGRLELTSVVNWPEGTLVEVRPLISQSNGAPEQQPSWLSLPPLDVGQFQESASDDLLGEMLDDSRG